MIAPRDPGACCAVGNAVPASTVSVGSAMFLARRGELQLEKVQNVTVLSVDRVVRTGVFNLHTLCGNVVVNDLVATHYGQPAWTSAPGLATVWYHVVDALSSVVGPEDAQASSISASLRSASEARLASVNGTGTGTSGSGSLSTLARRMLAAGSATTDAEGVRPGMAAVKVFLRS
jgi:hypothetical protein